MGQTLYQQVKQQRFELEKVLRGPRNRKPNFACYYCCYSPCFALVAEKSCFAQCMHAAAIVYPVSYYLRRSHSPESRYLEGVEVLHDNLKNVVCWKRGAAQQTLGIVQLQWRLIRDCISLGYPPPPKCYHLSVQPGLVTPHARSAYPNRMCFRSIRLPIPHPYYNVHHTAIRSRSSSGLTSRRGPPSAAASDFGNPHGDNDRVTNEFGNNSQSPPDTPPMESPTTHDDGHPSTFDGQEGDPNKEKEAEPAVGELLGKEFDEEVERQRVKEVAAEWGRKRGSGERTKTREKVNTRHPTWKKLQCYRTSHHMWVTASGAGCMPFRARTSYLYPFYVGKSRRAL